MGSTLIFIILIGFLSLNNPNPSINETNSTKGPSYFHDVETSPQNASYLILGATNIQMPEGAVVVTQVARVIKDSESNINSTVSPDHQPQSPKELVPYMEGARVKEIMNFSKARIIPATGVPVEIINNTLYGADDQGNFIFQIDPSKIKPLLAQKKGQNTYNVVETHGMSLLVPTAINNKAYLTVACGDTPGKAKAEAYMSSKGINCYAPCDRYTPLLIGNNGSGVILGSMPVRSLSKGTGALIGGQPIAIRMNERIVVQTTNKSYPSQYCDTPCRYFTCLQNYYHVKFNLEVVDANTGQTNKVVDQARKTGANVIAVRVENKLDRLPVEKWLHENSNHRAILFHSAPYDEGYPLFFEYPNQVTGQDTEPVFIKTIDRNDINKRFDQIRDLWGADPPYNSV